MKRPHWSLVFPVAVLAFVAPAVAYVNVLFTTTTRWVVAGVLLLALIATGRAFAILRHDVGSALLAYVAWCVLTSAWSDVPELTLMKSGALALVGVGMFAGGQLWASRRGWDQSLDFLSPVLALALFAGVFGQSAIESSSELLVLYEGLTGNPNMLGSLMNMAIPLLLWQCYSNRTSRGRLVLWLGLLGIIVGVLLLSVSRSSILAALVTCVVFLSVVGIRRIAIAYALATVVAAGTLFAAPDVYDTLAQRYILKVRPGTEPELFGSRQEVWEESYELAVQGGLVGGGYGVTIGETAFRGGLTAVGYGREKGNSQLAIMEETGVVGLLLYLIFLAVLFRKAAWPMRQAPDRDMKVMGALVFGALAGQTVQSLFEAWWVAPGSPEAAYFWAMSGVAVGLSIECRKQLIALRRVADPVPAGLWQRHGARRGDG
ncbi:MAG: O-antigen ligase family protein [Burkholderiales bacterium]